MSFHFREIRLKDWLVYGGETHIRLPDFKQGCNIIVVNGQNGYGKTSFLRGLSFVFRGHTSKQELLELWNERARRKKEGSLEVAIEFLHSDRVFKIVRGADFKPWGDTISVTPWVKLFIDDKEHTDQVQEKIEQLLPKDCLEFVFFDGAEISRYAHKQHEPGVRDAIEKVLGIPAVRNLRDDLCRLVEQLESEQEQLLSSSQQAKNLVSEIENIKEELEKYESRRRELGEKKQSLEQTKRELEAEAEGIEAIERERRELEEKLRRRATLEERLKELDDAIRQLIAQIPLLLLQKSLQRIVEDLRINRQPSVRKEELSAKLLVVRSLLKTDVCLCGRPLDDKAHEELSQLLEHLESEVNARHTHVTEADTTFLELSALLKSITANRYDPDELIDKRAAIATQIEEVTTDIRRLQKELENHEFVEIQELYQQIGQIRQQITEVSEQIAAVEKNIDRRRTELVQKQRQLAEIATGDDQARGLTRALEIARRLRQAVSEVVNELVQRKRLAIENKATQIFRLITNKPAEYDKIHVNDDYTLQVVRKDGTVVDNNKLSAGEKEVVAYSFITALSLSSRDPAPLVMDTPFGHLDSSHREGLLRSLPQLNVQVIILATDRDLPDDERDTIDGSIAKEFRLVRDQDMAISSIVEN
jgi:DNA sulfur modification protein DndD